jgi:hypothetical protein
MSVTVLGYGAILILGSWIILGLFIFKTKLFDFDE